MSSENLMRMSLAEAEKKLRPIVQRQYNEGLTHIRQERERKRSIMGKVLDVTVPEGQVRVNLLWRNIQLELALFLTDELGVKFLSPNGVVEDELMRNANLVAKYDDVTLNLRSQRETIVNHNALYGLAVTVVDGYDEDSSQPISDCIDPLSCIFDPSNYNDSKMGFFGFERRIRKETLTSLPGFERIDDEKYEYSYSSELERNFREGNTANNLNYIKCGDDDVVDVYSHYLVFGDKKYLTSWANDRETLLQLEELSPLTKAERKKPTKVKFPIQFHRRKPKLGSPFGVSIADEILQYQDAISILTNLQLIQANNLALGPDIYVDEKLGIDTETLSKRRPGGRIIPIENDTGLPTQNGIYTQQLPAPSPFVSEMEKKLEMRSEGTTNVSGQNFGVSQSGTQTKAEIQTLQQNANQILIWVSNNYLQGQKEYWEAHYRTYVENFGEKDKKLVSVFDSGKTVSRTLSRNEFVVDGNVIVFITSRSQDAIESDKEFNKLVALSNVIIASIPAGYPKNDFLRLLSKKASIRDFDEYRYIPATPDEQEAFENLALLNRDIEIPSPKDGEDYLTRLLVYRQALPTKAKAKAVSQYSEAYATIQKPDEEAKAQFEVAKGRGGDNSSADASRSASSAQGILAANTGIGTSVARS